MRTEILEAAENLSNIYVEKWKAEGGKIIGFPCTFVPEEIMYAAGMLPFRLRGIGAESTTFADVYFGPLICSFPKCILELVGAGKYGFLDGVVVSDGCDASRRMDECWRKAGEENRDNNLVPSFFHNFSTPHKVSTYSLQWFVKEIRRLISAIEDHFSLTISRDDLIEAIHDYNEGRELFQRMDMLREKEDVRISGTDATAIILASTAVPKKAFNRLLAETLDDFENSDKTEPIQGKRLLLAGSAVDDVSLVRLIENEGAVVVGDNQCFGSRIYVDEDDKDCDPVEALAKRYLDKTACPRMFGYYKDRFNFLKEQARKTGADGVILQNIRFCDLHGADNGLFQRDLQEEGIPSIMIEREYGPLSDDGRISMRVNAFLESIT